jgi:hypothetical protein
LHRYLRKEDCSSFVMNLLLALALLRVFLQQSLTVLTRQTRQVVCGIKKSIFHMVSMVFCFTCQYFSRATEITPTEIRVTEISLAGILVAEIHVTEISLTGILVAESG